MLNYLADFMMYAFPGSVILFAIASFATGEESRLQMVLTKAESRRFSFAVHPDSVLRVVYRTAPLPRSVQIF